MLAGSVEAHDIDRDRMLLVVSVWHLLLTGILTLIQRRLERHFGDHWTVTVSGKRGTLSRMFAFGGTPA